MKKGCAFSGFAWLAGWALVLSACEGGSGTEGMSPTLASSGSTVSVSVPSPTSTVTTLPTSTPTPTKSSTPTPTPTPTQTPSASPDASLAEQVFELTNMFRAENGVAPLTWNAQLTGAAQAFAEAMATQGFFSHTSPDGSSPGDRISATGYDAKTWGENIAYGYATPDAVMNGWINSAGHRANLLGNSYQEIGIGYAVRNGTAYWVQDFGARR